MRTLLASTALLCCATLASAQTTISTPGGDGVFYFGEPSIQTFGQTFTAPTNGDSRLDAFSFWMQDAPALNFRGYVYAWDGGTNRATGSALFTSAIMSGPSAGLGYHEVAVATGGVELVGGSMYVAFLSASGVSGSGQVGWELSPSDSYAGGEFVYNGGGEDTAVWTGNGWGTDVGSTDRDVRFAMTFNAADVSRVPEPATVFLSASGLLALGGVGALRRRRAAAKG